MAKRFLTIILCVLCALGSVSATDAELYMSADEIRRGMKGVGRTVFQGTRIDTFGVEVLGVLRNVFGPKSDMILARLSGGQLEQTGVIAGMSGSPVYIDGKLIGAVGYSIGSFAEEPIAGITPIKEMMHVLERASSDTLASAAFGSRKWEGQVAEINGGVLKPVAVPLMLSGFAPQVVSEFRQELADYGLLPMQGGGGTDTSLEVGAFEPGAPLGVQLIRGDLSVTGIGTLTHRVGDRVVGFGHPMLFSGKTAMPMTAAYIHQVVSSQMLSFKLGTASQSMGIILQDRAPGIAGVVGADADMIPVRVAVASPGQATSFNMEVFRHRELGPLLIRMAVATSVISAEKLMGETTVNGQMKLHLPGFEPVVIENMYAGPQGLGLAVLGLTQPLAQVMQNPFVDAAIDSAVFQLSVEERTRGARIDGLRLDRSSYDPGDTVQVSVTLAPLLGKREVIDLRLPISSHVTPGRLMLQVVNERAQRLQDQKRVPGAYQPKNLTDLLHLIQQPGRNDALVVRFVASQPGVTMGGREVSGLPMSVMSALSFSRGSDVVQKSRQSIFGQKRVMTDYVLSGTQSAVFMVGKEGNGPTFSGKGASGEQKR
ncbi:MAG: SpoIVB peptidase S55 domain-containing protein [Candidatus Latescibacteria bacterium]|nr:SpoIVB peptidase S55 domain-containing protein [Candidatus Latescibacterota bacterium]